MSCSYIVAEHPHQDAAIASTTRRVIESRPLSASETEVIEQDKLKFGSKRETNGLAELNRLLVVSEPLPEENIIAFLLRLTELNDYDKLAWILSLVESTVGLYSSMPLFFSRGQDLSRLVKLTGLSEASCVRCSIHRLRRPGGPQDTNFSDT